jgi:hypothetical protein
MKAKIIKIDKGIAFVQFASEDYRTQVALKLNFGQERLQVDIFAGLDTIDDGTADSARAAAKVGRFKLDYLKNGILEVWDADAEKILGRCDAFIPTNVDMGRTIANFETAINELEAEAHKRASAQRV